MDWIDWVIDLVTLLILGRLVMILLRIEKWMSIISRKVDEQKARQSSIAARRASTSTPSVDAKARTTKRDSNDLPATGRMSMGIHRKKRDYNG